MMKVTVAAVGLIAVLGVAPELATAVARGVAG
jgi:hypothetical protein